MAYLQDYKTKRKENIRKEKLNFKILFPPSNQMAL